MGMKVCKYVRITKKDVKGNFVKPSGTTNEGLVTIRSRVVVSDETIKETEDNFATTGLLYIVDKKATAKRDKEVADEYEKATGEKMAVPSPSVEEEEEAEEEEEDEEKI